MWASIVSVSNILIVAALFFIMFGILGVSLFMGRFHHCQVIRGVPASVIADDSADIPGVYIEDADMIDWDTLAEAAEAPAITKDACLALGGGKGATEWRNSPDNFDNIGRAIATLFQMSTGQARSPEGRRRAEKPQLQ